MIRLIAISARTTHTAALPAARFGIATAGSGDRLSGGWGGAVGLERRFDSTTAGRVRPFRRPSLMRVSFIAFPPPRAQERGRAHVAVTLFHCPKFDAAARVSLSHCLRNLT